MNEGIHSNSLGWWHTLSNDEQDELYLKYYGASIQLGVWGDEIEEIWKSEHGIKT